MFKQMFRLMRRRSALWLREFCVLDSAPLSQRYLIVTQNKRPTTQLLQKVYGLNVCSRGYAKNRDKKKEKNKKVRFDEAELRDYIDVEKLLSDLGRPFEVFKDELVKHATVRTSAGAIENIKVEFEGEEYTIQDLAEVGKKGSSVYVLDFVSFPSAIAPAMKVLQKSELNLNVQQEGTRVIVPLPKVTKEHRELLARKSKLYFVKCREGIRDVQMKYIKSLGKMERLPSQDKFRLIEQLTALGDQHIQQAQDLLKTKQDDLLKEDD